MAGLEPLATETAITKAKPSAFFGTCLGRDAALLLVRHSHHHRGDDQRVYQTTVNDAFSFNYRMIVPVLPWQIGLGCPTRRDSSTWQSSMPT